MFYNFSDGKWEHHWSQFNSSDGGAGIIFRDLSNLNLYAFDALAGQSSGALNITTQKQTTWMTTIEFSPIKLKSVSFQQPLDITWFGAVVTIKNTEMIYDPSSNVGLWVIVEHPPKVEIIV